MKPEAPISWLWQQLEQLLSDATLDTLRSGYAEQSKRYNHMSQLKNARHELALYERIVTTYGPDSQQHRHYAARIERRKARIKVLEDELNVIDDVS